MLSTLVTVPMTCVLKVRSDVARLILAIVMVRAFTATPKPRRKLCCTWTERVAADEGFKTSLGEFSFRWWLLRVPVMLPPLSKPS